MIRYHKRNNPKGFVGAYRDYYPWDNVIQPLNDCGHINWSYIKYTFKTNKQQKQEKNKLHGSLIEQDESCRVTLLQWYPLKSYSFVFISVFARRLNTRRWLIFSRPVLKLSSLLGFVFARRFDLNACAHHLITHEPILPNSFNVSLSSLNVSLFFERRPPIRSVTSGVRGNGSFGGGLHFR